MKRTSYVLTYSLTYLLVELSGILTVYYLMQTPGLVLSRIGPAGNVESLPAMLLSPLNWLAAVACISFVAWCEHRRPAASRLFHGPFKNTLLLPYYILLIQAAMVVNNLVIMAGGPPPVSFFTQLFAVNRHFLGFMTMAVLLCATSSSLFMILVKRRYGAPQDVGPTRCEENNPHPGS